MNFTDWLHSKMGSTFVLLLTIGVIMPLYITAQKHKCTDEECVDLHDCPELSNLLKKPSNANIRKLQDATCFISNRVPKVCCPKKSEKLSLLPKTSCGQGLTDGRIHGGEETEIGEYPWMAIFGYKNKISNKIVYKCGGSIINDRYILTAAHCVAPELLAIDSLEVITLGEWDVTTAIDCKETLNNRFCAPTSQNFTYEKIILHPDYNKRAQHSDDIALIRLNQKVDLSGNFIHPICLPPQGLEVRRVLRKTVGVAAGWGTTENGTSSERLLHVELPLVDRIDCNITYRGNTVKEQICMGGVEGQDSCGGDSGGPLIAKGPNRAPSLQIGIVSYGPLRCGIESVPGVYTDVSYYIDWIENNLQP